MKKRIITIADIRESLYDENLDTEYRESLANFLIEKKYLSDSPLRLYMGTEEQRKELEKVDKTPLKPSQIKEIMNYIDNEMEGDYQYTRFKNIAEEYIGIANKMELEEEEEFE